jgi:hypothetical protein
MAAAAAYLTGPARAAAHTKHEQCSTTAHLFDLIIMGSFKQITPS